VCFVIPALRPSIASLLKQLEVLRGFKYFQSPLEQQPIGNNGTSNVNKGLFTVFKIFSRLAKKGANIFAFQASVFFCAS
jgi:hypothetical protein